MIEYVKRDFIVGDKWIYYKLYTGPKTSEILLTEFIKPIAEELIEECIIDHWFFIRYLDPNYHLRIRFHCIDQNNLATVIQKLHIPLKDYINQNLIWKVQLDTYQRELERYGSNTIKLTEEIFYHDSKMIVELIEMITGEEGEEIRWLFGLKAIDSLLSNFEFSILEKLGLLETLKISYGNEFGMNRDLKKQLDIKYRKFSEKIDDFMGFTPNNNITYAPILILIEKKSKEILPIVKELLEYQKSNKLEVHLDSLLGSYIHMLMNRLFKTKARLHEMVCYDFLFRYYKSKFARQQHSNL